MSAFFPSKFQLLLFSSSLTSLRIIVDFWQILAIRECYASFLWIPRLHEVDATPSLVLLTKVPCVEGLRGCNPSPLKTGHFNFGYQESWSSYLHLITSWIFFCWHHYASVIQSIWVPFFPDSFIFYFSLPLSLQFSFSPCSTWLLVLDMLVELCTGWLEIVVCLDSSPLRPWLHVAVYM